MNPLYLNLWASAIVAISAFSLLGESVQKKFSSFSTLSIPFVHAAFVLWTLSRLGLVFLYIRFIVSPPAPSGTSNQVLLAIIDAGTLLSLWSLVVLLRGASHLTFGSTLREVGALYTILLVWNFSFRYPGSSQTGLWLLAAALGIVLSYVLAIVAFWKRYGLLRSSGFLFVLSVNTWLQIPAFIRTLVKHELPTTDTFVILALLKILMALLFYQLILSTPSHIEPFSLAKWLEGAHSKKILIVSVATVVLVLLAYLGVRHADAIADFSKTTTYTAITVILKFLLAPVTLWSGWRAILKLRRWWRQRRGRGEGGSGKATSAGN